MQPNSPYPPASPSSPHPPEYGFIMDPEKQPRNNPLRSLGNGPPLVKIALVLGGLLLVIIVFAILSSVLRGGGNTEALTAVAQQQQEILHIAKNPTGQSSGSSISPLSATNQNSVSTVQVTISSAQTQLLEYMQLNGKKVKDKALVAKLSATTDQQLASASTNSTFNATLKQVMQAELKDYETSLQQAYNQTKGLKGRALLSQQYKGAQLLLQQLNSPES